MCSGFSFASMRILAIVLGVLIAALQYPLWVGKGSWLAVWALDQQVADRKLQNTKLLERNVALEAEVHDLKSGTDAIEERARNELSMIRSDEVFFQILDKKRTVASAPAPAIIAAPVVISQPVMRSPASASSPVRLSNRSASSMSRSSLAASPSAPRPSHPHVVSSPVEPAADD